MADAGGERAGVLRNRRFWQFLAMAAFTLNQADIPAHGRHVPQVRGASVRVRRPFGSIYAINPAMIILGVPIVAAATPRAFDTLT